MATYFHDFADGLTGWTGDQLGETGVTWSTSGGALQENTSSVNEGLKYDSVDSTADIEVVAKVQGCVGSAAGRNLFARGGSDWYYARLRGTTSNTVAVGKVISGAATSLSSVAAGFTIDLTGTWYWMRFRVNGTSLKLRVWADGSGEPGTWQVDTTDSALSSGNAGAVTSAASITQQWQYIGFGTDGDTAPTEAGGGAASIVFFRRGRLQQHLLVR